MDKRVKSVLIVVNSLKWLVTVREELIIAILEKGCTLDIIGLFDGGEDKLMKLGCNCHNSSIQRRGTNVFSDFSLLNSYRKVMKMINPDVVLTFSIKANIYGSLAARMLKKPYICTITGLGTGLQEKNLLSKSIILLYKISLAKAEVVIFQNSANLQFMKDKKIVSNDDKIRIVSGSGVNLEKHTLCKYPDEKNGYRFLFIGRLMKEKGVDELLEAFEGIRKNSNDTQLVIVGFAEEDYKNLINDLAQKPGVTYRGEISDVRPDLRAAHCIVLPSYHEGMANVLLEAAATGRPVIASDIPGCKETFDEGISGYGCKPQDSMSLQITMEKFLDLPHSAKAKMGEAGRKKVEKEFDRRQVIADYIYEIERIE